MDLGLKDKVAVVCGGSTGIGAAAAAGFAAEGCHVAVCGRSEEKLDAFRMDMRSRGFQDVMVEAVDAMKAAEVRAFADRVVKKFGRIDIWINCAGGNRHGPVDTLSEEDYRYILDLNLSTAFFGVQAAAFYMKQQKGGVIINVSSLSSLTPVTYRVMYGAAKAGVNVMTKGAAAELAPFGIRVNAVAPGVTDTVLMAKAIYENTAYTMSKIPVHRAGKPEEIGDLIVCLSSARLGYVTGSIFTAHGGQGIVEDTETAWTSPWN
ncbi:SDR family oxidoreductase [Anaerolentibacter hominis]|uniref:SDR family NAD(P)-dependent oxidoreductase n=1 Tax=Anaerolentibacter hominis TaxID=3079009 RepID=UPI0031B863F1